MLLFQNLNAQDKNVLKHKEAIKSLFYVMPTNKKKQFNCPQNYGDIAQGKKGA